MTSATRSSERGGLYFEEFEVGAVIRHKLTRTVTQMDNMLFSNMTLNPQPLHIDAHFNGTTIANLGMTDVRFPHPLFENDSIHCTTEITEKRESRSRPDAGIVTLLHRAYNQHYQLVAECHRQAFMLKRPQQG